MASNILVRVVDAAVISGHRWVNVSLSGVHDTDRVAVLKKVIKEKLRSELDHDTFPKLILKATRDDGDERNAVMLKDCDKLESVLAQFAVCEPHCTVLESFSNNILLFLEPELFSESDFLKLCPPPVDYIDRLESTGTTNCSRGRTPRTVVVTWDAFKQNVNRTTWDDIPKYSPPAFQEFEEIHNEMGVQSALERNVLFPLNILLKSRGAGEAFARSIYLGKIVGEPDFIQHSNKEELRLAIEVKTKWALTTSDLVATYARNHTEHHAKIPSPISLRRIFGYLSHNHLQFGALTTYDNTWFLYRPRENPGQLCISPPIQYDNQQPTLFQCLFYLTSLARDGHDCGSAPPSLPLPPPCDNNLPPDGGDDGDDGDDDDGNGGEELIPLEFFDWDSFSTLSVLGTGRSGTVFKAILHGEMVALKICDLWQHPHYKKELLNEVKVYHALKDLQGYCIPRFKGAGYTAGGLWATATDIVGSPLKDVKSLSDQERLVIQTALSSIHRHGFVHNDIRKDNILIKRDGSQFSASFIDFAFSKQGRRRDFQKEMKFLASLLRQM